MKNVIIFYIILLQSLICKSEISKVVTINAGYLSKSLTYQEKISITKLIINGNIDARDIKFIRDSLSNLLTIDISNVDIKEYRGIEGTINDNLVYAVNDMPKYAFYGNTNLKTIILPKSFWSYGIQAFTNIPNLEEFIVPKYSPFFFSENGALYNKSITTLIQCPAQLNGNFRIPNTVTKVAGSAFINCFQINSIYVPCSVKYFGSYCFSDCKYLKSIIVNQLTPPEISQNILESVNLTNCKLEVPKNSIPLYEKALVWKDFKLIEEIDASELEDSVSICKWKDGAKAFMNFSFDDGCVSQLKISKILDSYNFKGTFFVIANSIRANDIRDMVLRNHEIGSHTYSHYILNDNDSITVDVELKKSMQMIESSSGKMCVSFAEPYDIWTNLGSRLAFKYYLFVRSHSDYLKHNALPLTSDLTIDRAMMYINEGINNKEMLLFSGHGIDGDGYSPISHEFSYQLLDSVKSLSESNILWVGTFQEGNLYENLYNEIILEKKRTLDSLIIQIRKFDYVKYSKMDSAMISIELPLSISKNVYCKSKFVRIKKNIDKYIVTFDLKRDTSILLILNSKDDFEVDSNVDASILDIYPNPIYSILEIKSVNIISSIEIFDIFGHRKMFIKGNVTQLDLSKFSSGKYLVRISTLHNNRTEFISRSFIKT